MKRSCVVIYVCALMFFSSAVLGQRAFNIGAEEARAAAPRSDESALVPSEADPDGDDGEALIPLYFKPPCDDRLFVANLTGDQVVPPVMTIGGGLGVLSLDDNHTVAVVVLSAFNLMGQVLAAHIHNAPPGQNGPVVFSLVKGPFQNPLIRTWRLSPEQFALLRTGMLYMDVHTTAYPDGEIRGQILHPGE